MLKEIDITVTAEEVERLSPEELAYLIQLRFDKALINDLKRVQEVNNIDG